MAYCHQPCDSYFVESHQGREKRFLDQLRARERHVKQQKQLEIADQLSLLASYEYKWDILQQMEIMEVKPFTIKC